MPDIPQRTAAPGLEIHIASGSGSGPTKLAAFDAALRSIGIADYNLIRLSSVIPPCSILTVSQVPLSPAGQWGDRLYVVSAEGHTDVPGDEAWAGIGWIQDNEIGHGLLVEHEGHSEAEVRADIAASLGSLRTGRGHVGDRLGDVQLVTHGALCTYGPVCAIVVAAFSTETWAPASSRSQVTPGVGALWPMRLGPMRLGLHG